MDILYDKIELLCNKKGINITTMCRDAGISRAPLSDLKAGRSKTLSSTTLSKIASYFGVSVDYLLGNTEQKEKPLINGDEELTEYLEELKSRPELKMLFRLTKNATKEDVEKAVKIIEAYLDK